MKTLPAIGLALLLLTALPACAAQPPARTAPATAAGAAQPDQAQMAQLQANMKTMQEQMQRIAATQDPAERRRLMQDHVASMRSSMALMHGLMGQGMSCCASGGGGMMGSGGMMMGHQGPMTPEQMQERHRHMETMMGMQLMMMDQMLQHQQLEQAQ